MAIRPTSPTSSWTTYPHTRMPEIAKLAEVTVKTQGFSEGIDLQSGPNMLAPTEVRRAENGVLDERGGFTKRLGCQNQGAVGGGADRIISSYVFNRGAVTPPQFLIHTSAGQVFYTNDPTTNPVVWTQIPGAWSISQPMTWETFNSKVYFGDGVTAYSAWDGTTKTTPAGAPV